MILWIECLIGCVLFGSFILISVLKNPLSWIQEYPEPVQKRYIELHPESSISKVQGLTPKVILLKVLVCLVFVGLLTGMIYITGDKEFLPAFRDCYLLWFVVNAFDTFVIDFGVMVHWKKCRLPGTEDMDEAYKLLNKKSLLDGLYGCLIGIPVSILVGIGITLL